MDFLGGRPHQINNVILFRLAFGHQGAVAITLIDFGRWICAKLSGYFSEWHLDAENITTWYRGILCRSDLKRSLFVLLYEQFSV